MQIVKPDLFLDLPNLEYLYLSYNRIKEIVAQPFPVKLIHLDLSYNTDTKQTIPDELKMTYDAFWPLIRLETLDFSYTRIEPRSALTLGNLPQQLSRLSLCYTELPALSEQFILNNSFDIKLLDLSGNPVLSMNQLMFTKFEESLEVLWVRSSNVKSLEWARSLTNLKNLNLYDNNIHNVTNAFTKMSSLEILNLEKNAVGNWYDQLFEENDVLKILNLRDNKLSSLSDEMKADMSTVQRLALGKNEFECTCVLEDFMNALFQATKNANLTNPMMEFQTNMYYNNDYEENYETVSETTRVHLSVRNYLRPEYDVISRTYQKYYEMAEKSIQALKASSSKADMQKPQRQRLTIRSNAAYGSNFETILFDYDEDDDNYKCRNVTSKTMMSIIALDDLCGTRRKDDRSEYHLGKSSLILTLSISIPLVVAFSALGIVVYWKWGYIRYFLVLCRDSAILSFMDDSDGGNDAIIKGKGEDAMEIYLYDVFVSYCEQNRNWVLDEFIPNVEQRESINVCLHERDFQVGYGILENIVSCMDRSRCLLLLVSENFLQSQWCQFEMNLAQHRLLETRREKLILVLLEDIPERKQPKTLKYLMRWVLLSFYQKNIISYFVYHYRTKTYIKWPANGSKEDRQLFWRRLKKAVITSKWENDSYGSFA